MVKFAPFALERWMAGHNGKAEYDLSESSCFPISISQLQKLSSDPSVPPISFDTIQGYGDVCGSEELRTNIAALYPGANLPAENVLATPGSSQGNFLVFYALVDPGDHLICQYPTYQQLYSVPESLGAKVSLWRAKVEDGWRLDVNELEQMITPQTKMIVINNPNNPTGGHIPQSDLEKIVRIASERDIYLFSDEVFAPLFHSFEKDDPELPSSALKIGYKRTIVTGSVSKVFSLPGLRLGWVASNDPEVIEKTLQARDFTTISCTLFSDRIAAYALAKGTASSILKRNNVLAKKNAQILDDFIKQHPGKVSWVKPKAGTTGFVCFYKDGKPIEDEKFCEDVIATAGVHFAPGKYCFGNGEDFRGYVRIGYVVDTDTLVQALEQLKGYIDKEL